jgi:hypothetical protein
MELGALSGEVAHSGILFCSFQFTVVENGGNVRNMSESFDTYHFVVVLNEHHHLSALLR